MYYKEARKNHPDALGNSASIEKATKETAIKRINEAKERQRISAEIIERMKKGMTVEEAVRETYEMNIDNPLIASRPNPELVLTNWCNAHMRELARKAPRNDER